MGSVIFWFVVATLSLLDFGLSAKDARESCRSALGIRYSYQDTELFEVSDSLLRAVAREVDEERLMRPPYRRGFQLLAAHFSPQAFLDYIHETEARGLAWKHSRKARKAKSRYPLFRVHPDFLVELSRVLTALLRQADHPRMALREKDIIENLVPTIAKMNSKQIIDYRDNAFMGYVDELRAAAYYAEQGYEIVRLHYDFAKAPRAPDTKDQPVGELDIILEDPETGGLVMVEVKSKLDGKRTDQLDRYVTFLKRKRNIIYDHRFEEFRPLERGILFSSAPVSDKLVKKLNGSHPSLEVSSFPDELRRHAVLPRVYALKTFHASY